VSTAYEKSGLKLQAVMKGVVPFTLVILVGIVRCIAFPVLVTWLPSTMIVGRKDFSGSPVEVQEGFAIW
jgi:hypothetical protein